MADVDPLNRPVSGQNLSVLIPALLGNVTRSAGLVVLELDADDAIDSWDEVPTTPSSIAFLVRVDATTATTFVTLPPSGTDAGRLLAIIKTDAGGNAVTVEVDNAGVEDIAGDTDFDLAAQWGVALLMGRTDGWDRIV